MTTATLRITDALCSNEKISAYGSARSTIQGAPLSPDELRKVDAYWRASLYLCLGMLYLKDNPLLREPLKLEHTKPRLLGHWGSDPGQSFVYTHFNRLINKPAERLEPVDKTPRGRPSASAFRLSCARPSTERRQTGSGHDD